MRFEGEGCRVEGFRETWSWQGRPRRPWTSLRRSATRMPSVIYSHTQCHICEYPTSYMRISRVSYSESYMRIPRVVYPEPYMHLPRVVYAHTQSHICAYSESYVRIPRVIYAQPETSFNPMKSGFALKVPSQLLYYPCSDSEGATRSGNFWPNCSFW